MSVIFGFSVLDDRLLLDNDFNLFLLILKSFRVACLGTILHSLLLVYGRFIVVKHLHSAVGVGRSSRADSVSGLKGDNLGLRA